jgi:hypothetical protein
MEACLATKEVFMLNPIAGVNDGYTFEQHAQLYFSNFWGVDLQKDSVLVLQL